MTPPCIRIDQGQPTDDELAALVAALLALVGRAGPARRLVSNGYRRAGPARRLVSNGYRRAGWPGSRYRSPMSWR